jgi:hypothetical protein
MTNAVNLFIKAEALKVGKDLIRVIEHAITNSIACLTDIHQSADHVTSFTIQITSDKLEKLYDQLALTGLHMQDNAHYIISNAATQYSVYREIFVMLNISHVS